MGDQDQRHAFGFLQVNQKIKDLRLNGHIKRRCGFIRNQQFGFTCKRHGDHHTLAHSARQLVREGGQALGRIGNADLIHQLNRASLPFRTVQRGMLAQHLFDLAPHGVAGVQRRHRFLKNHRHVFADDFAPVAGGHFQQVLPVKFHFFGGDIGGPGQKPHHRQHRHGFTGSTFAHDGAKVPRLDGHIHAVHGPERTVCGAELYGEVFYL